MFYQPLHLSREEIRLLHLLPEDIEQSGSATLNYSIEHHSIFDDPEYYTLPYTLGDPSITDTIKIDGEEVQVTTNLRVHFCS